MSAATTLENGVDRQGEELTVKVRRTTANPITMQVIAVTQISTPEDVKARAQDILKGSSEGGFSKHVR